MGRIALFVVAVGGLSYLILDLVVGGLIGVSLSPVVSVSVSVIIAVIAWTVLIWMAGDRLGRRTNTRPMDARPADRRSEDAGPDEA
jgi:hypothetical protein